MRASTFIMIAVAAVFGLLAVFAARTWLQSQAHVQHVAEPVRGAPMATRSIVVANRALRFGHDLSTDVLQEIPWPADALPDGAYARIGDVLAAGKRVVLSPIEANEPVLAMKITGPGQRATLSALVAPGMKAVTIRVNDVEGVGGFVLPGDRVDVILTRQVDKDNASTHVLLQDVRVLAVDQMADERSASPTIPKAVTLEVEMEAGQKLGLAATVGTLSLLLRKAGETHEAKTARVTLRDLLNELTVDTGGKVDVVVNRRQVKQSYRVPLEGARKPSYANAAGD